MNENVKNVLRTAALVLVLASCGNKDNGSVRREESRRPVLAEETDIEDSPMPSPLSAAVYSIKLSNDTLSMYEVSDGNEILVKSIIIDPSYYPPEDISELNAGITAYTKEDGFEILENFAN